MQNEYVSPVLTQKGQSLTTSHSVTTCLCAVFEKNKEDLFLWFSAELVGMRFIHSLQQRNDKSEGLGYLPSTQKLNSVPCGVM